MRRFCCSSVTPVVRSSSLMVSSKRSMVSIISSQRPCIKHILSSPTVSTTNFSDFVLNPTGTADVATSSVKPVRWDADAFIDAESGERLTFAQNFENVCKFRAHLKDKYDVQPGDVVCILSCNTIHYAAMWHGVVSIGAVASTVNSLATVEELSKQLILSSARVLVTLPPFAESATAAIEKASLGNVVKLCVFSSEVCLSGRSCSESPRPVSLNDTCALPFSSGTTGMPKGVRLSHMNLLANVMQTNENERAEHDDVYLDVLPFFHIYGLTVNLNLGLRYGVTQVVFKKFDLGVYVDALSKYEPTHLFVAPPLAVALAKHPQVATAQRDSVKQIFSGAAPLGGATQSEVAARFPNAYVRQGYGLTETSPGVITQRIFSRKTGTIGAVVSSTEVMLVRETDELSGAPTSVASAPGEEGELWVRGPQVMLGYLQDSDTAQVMAPGGWFRTGDILKRDQDDDFYVTDRLKELIKVKGFQVAPAELEAILHTHPDVQDVVVLGIPDEQCGEMPKAHIQLKSGRVPSSQKEDEIMTFLSRVVAPYKRLKGIRFVDSIPKSPSGKLLRRVSRQLEM